MTTLKEQLAARSDMRERDVELPEFNLAVRIRRMTIGERKMITERFKLGQNGADPIGAGIAVTAMSLVPPCSEDDIKEMPSAVVDAVTDKINQFNGWTKKGDAENVDQFRPTA